MKLLDTLRTLLDMSPEKAAREPESQAFPQLHLPLWHRREKDAPIRVLLLGGPLNRKTATVFDAHDPDIHIPVLRRGAVIAPCTVWYRMRRVPLEGFSMHRTAYYVGVVGEVAAGFAPDSIVP